MIKIYQCYGGGTNSVAMSVGLYERGIRPNEILFADTGAEKPHTYEHIELMQKWCESVGFPQITILRATGKTLEQDCLDRHALPAIAYGFKTCSQRWKVQPQQVYINSYGKHDYVKLVGIDCDEPHRVKDYPDTRYPLIEWGWGRDECIAAIKRHNLPLPGKSACFFCPSTKVHEIKWLSRNLPEYAERALALEANADLESIRGLGRTFSWKEVIDYDKRQMDFFCESLVQVDCGCYDGEAA
jgi:hypothetical protein